MRRVLTSETDSSCQVGEKGRLAGECAQIAWGISKAGGVDDLPCEPHYKIMRLR